MSVTTGMSVITDMSVTTQEPSGVGSPRHHDGVVARRSSATSVITGISVITDMSVITQQKYCWRGSGNKNLRGARGTGAHETSHHLTQPGGTNSHPGGNASAPIVT